VHYGDRWIRGNIPSEAQFYWGNKPSKSQVFVLVNIPEALVSGVSRCFRVRQKESGGGDASRTAANVLAPPFGGFAQLDRPYTCFIPLRGYPPLIVAFHYKRSATKNKSAVPSVPTDESH